MVNVVYKTALEIWDTPPLKKLEAQKHHNFGAILDNFATWRPTADWHCLVSARVAAQKWVCRLWAVACVASSSGPVT